MKITFICPTVNLSGGIRVAAIHGERLKERGHQVVFVSTPPRPPSLREKVRSLRHGRGWPATPSRGASHLDGVALEHHVIDRYRPIADGDVPDADVVVATWWETAEWVASLSPRKGAKAYFVQHHEVFPWQPIDRVKATYRLPLHKIVVSRWLEGIMSREYGDADVSLVPNSVDTAQFHAPARGKQSVPTVGFMVSSAAFKRSEFAVRACLLARRQVPGLRVVAFGDQPVGPALPEGTRFTCRPAQDSIRHIYASCDAWLLSSSVEGFGLPILESMACRTPVIATPAGAAPELIGRGGGVPVSPEDPADMARAIVGVCQMPEPQWRAMSDAAYATATDYSWADAAGLFEAALRRTTDRARTGHVAGGGFQEGTDGVRATIPA